MVVKTAPPHHLMDVLCIPGNLCYLNYFETLPGLHLNPPGTKAPIRQEGNATPVFLPGESQGRGSLVGFHLWGRTESDTTEVTYLTLPLVVS